MTSWQANIPSITQIKVSVEERAQMLQAHKERMNHTVKEAWVATVEVKCHLKNNHHTSRAEEIIITLNTKETFRSKGALCTASTCITQVFLKSNTKHSSTCAVFNRSHSTLSLVKALRSCSKTASNQVYLPWWQSPRTVKKPFQWWTMPSSSSNNKQAVLEVWQSQETC